MTYFKITNQLIKNVNVPEFSFTIEAATVMALYSDTDLQAELLNGLRTNGRAMILDWQDGLYERLTVEDNLSFYHKWFACQTPLPEILVLFQLQNNVKTPLHQCSPSEVRRVYYAKYFMGSSNMPLVFLEPVHGVDILTMNTFLNMIKELQKSEVPILVLVTNLEHALLLGDRAYKIDKKGLHLIETESEENQEMSEAKSSTPSVVNLYKVPAKVDDKVILFDPLEIDYIESQEGKAQIVINNESFALDMTLTEIEKKLQVYGFFRCHRSYIVNLQKVREIITWSKNTYSLKIDNQIESTIPLSRTKIQEIQGIFNLK